MFVAVMTPRQRSGRDGFSVRTAVGPVQVPGTTISAMRTAPRVSAVKVRSSASVPHVTSAGFMP
ncbi:hypothetical protein M2162_000907 [Streptomyces sp. SAI-041]|nr:hypothetical protein [Streptomyces sp. SAI-041]